MTARRAVSNSVSQTIAVRVTTAGTYNIATGNINGVTFFGTGRFLDTGFGTVVLTATGTPLAATASPYIYTINTSPSCSFNRAVSDSSSGGSAVIDSILGCNIGSTGTMTVGTQISINVSQTIAVRVKTAGDYNITTGNVNGVTFSRSGRFDNAGIFNVILNASGIPSALTPSLQTFTLNTSPSCSFSRIVTNASSGGGPLTDSILSCSYFPTGTMTAGTRVTSDVSQSIIIRVINPGPYSITTDSVNGVTFFGSGNYTVGIDTVVLTATGIPVTAAFTPYTYTINTSPSCSFNRVVSNISSGGTAVIGSISCVGGGTGAMTVGTSVSTTNVSQAITIDVTKLGSYNIRTDTVNGVTFSATGDFSTMGLQTIELVASGIPVAASDSPFIYTIITSPSCSFNRTVSNLSSGGTAVLGSLNCNVTSSGTMTARTRVSGVSQTIQVQVNTPGSYNISTSDVNGVTFSGIGRFTGTGPQTLELAAAGTPSLASGFNSPYSYTINTSPSCSFTREVIDSSSGGTAVLGPLNCNISSSGTMIARTLIIPPSVSQTIRVTFTTPGTYNIRTDTVNGVTFFASGIVSTAGTQDVVLTAAGTPSNSSGSNPFSYRINTSPSCSFTRQVIDSSSRGTAVFSGITNCTTVGSAGAMITNNPVSGVTQSIMVHVKTPGSYNISTATVNGVTFSAAGEITTTGFTTIVLTATGIPASAAASPYSYPIISLSGCTFPRVVTPSLPAGLTLLPVVPHYVASVFDNDFLPYSAPTAAATFETPVAAGGGIEPVPLNIQGELTTSGVLIGIPYTAGAPVTLPPYSQTITIPSASTEDGLGRDVSFSYSGTTLGIGTGTIIATLKAIGGTLNVKKLDLQAGVGNDNMGVLLAQFPYATNSTGAIANFQYRAIAGIPDGNITDPSHRLLYFPVTGPDNRTWLNNNLGANYSNINNANFNPTWQATSLTDHHAFGSLFQWGRYSDGHELVNWTSNTTPTGSNSTGIQSGSNQPGHSSFILVSVTGGGILLNWRSPGALLWADVNHINNPCPLGYRLPDEQEMNTIQSLGISNAATAYTSSLRLTFAGRRIGTNTWTNSIDNGVYWTRILTTSIAALYSRALTFNATIFTVGDISRGTGASVRCIRN
jgi:hypothetical protein